MDILIRRKGVRSVPKKALSACAVVDIGSHAVRMDIGTVSASGKLTVLESLSRPLAIGYDVFRHGSISSAALEKLVHTLKLYREKLREYDISRPRMVATSALREAFNQELASDRLKNEVDLDLEILESTQEITIVYLALREELERSGLLNDLHAIIPVLGAGSLFVVYVQNGEMRFCEELPLGSMRIYDTFGRAQLPPESLLSTLKSANIPQRLKECGLSESSTDRPKLILLGVSARNMAGALTHDAPPGENRIVKLDNRKLRQLLDKLLGGSAYTLSNTLDITPADRADLELGSHVVDYFLRKFNCSETLVSGITTRSALMADSFRREQKLRHDPFTADLISLCRTIGRKYGCDANHAQSVALMADKIYRKLKNNFTFPPRSELLLAAAGFLHDIGRFVDVRRHNRHSAYLISNMQLPGLTLAEREIVALAARYHRKSPPRESHPEYMLLPAETKVAVLKLAAILRVADALDSGHDGKFSHAKITREGDTLFFLAENDGNVEGERFSLENKGELFTQVFGLKLKVE